MFSNKNQKSLSLSVHNGTVLKSFLSQNRSFLLHFHFQIVDFAEKKTNKKIERNKDRQHPIAVISSTCASSIATPVLPLWLWCSLADHFIDNICV